MVFLIIILRPAGVGGSVFTTYRGVIPISNGGNPVIPISNGV